MEVRLALLSGLLLVGCAPPLPQLLAHKHYREAVCVGGAAEDRVAEALLRDLAPQVRVDALHLQVDEGAPVRAYRLRYSTNVVPLDRLEVQLEPESKALTPVSLEALAALTHEKLPQPKTVDPSLAAEVVSTVLIFATVGIIRLDVPGAHVEYPSTAELRTAAPRAFTLYEQLHDRCEPAPTDGVGVRCTHTFLELSPQAGVVRLTLNLVAFTRETPCTLSRDFHVKVDDPRFAQGFVPLGS